MRLGPWLLPPLIAIAASIGCSPAQEVADEPAPNAVEAADELVSDEVAELSPAESTTTESTVAPPETSSTTTMPLEPLRAFEANEALGRGINLGNSLEGPREGDWGALLEARFFTLIADEGFGHVRLPVSWAGYAGVEAPYTIPDGVDPTIDHPDYDNIWERVDWAIEQALANDLRIIVNMHHYDEAHENPAAHRDRMIAMWEQIAQRYADQPDEVYFELFNEPHGGFSDDPALWNQWAADLLAVVRETNPTRKVLIGPVGFNHINELDSLVLPDDPYVIATVHLYEPFAFTHQGAEWVDPIPATGVEWSADGVALDPGVSHASWDTVSSVDDNGDLRLDYQRQWAGYSIEWSGPKQFQDFELEVSGNTSLRIGCRIPDQDLLGVAQIPLTPEPATHVIDLSVCPSGTTGFGIMNETENLDPVVISELRVCIVNFACSQTYESAEDDMRAWVKRAADWGAANAFPVHLGEFGAYSAGGTTPLEDRVEWTATVADEAAEQGLSSSYWEFNAGYGVYDLNADAWIPELRDALLD